MHGPFRTSTLPGVLTLAFLAIAVMASAAPDAPAPDPAQDAILQALIDELSAPAPRRGEVRAQLVAIGSEATPALLSRRDDPSEVRRWEIVTIFGMTRDPAALPTLARAVVEDPDSHVRWRSIWAIRAFPLALREPAAELLLKALEGGNESMRWNAAVGLAELGRDDGLALLNEGLGSSQEWRRWEAIHALGSVNDSSSSARLVPALSSSLESERAEAVQSLGKIGGEGVLPLLISALEDPAPGVRARAARWLGLSASAEAVAPLQSVLAKETDELVRRQLERALEKLGA